MNKPLSLLYVANGNTMSKSEGKGVYIYIHGRISDGEEYHTVN